MPAGNWIPELVELAGGTSLLSEAGRHSPWITWKDLIEADPEFVVVMPESTAEEARGRADQIRTKVAGLNLEFRGEQLGQITISVGVAAYPEAGTTTDELISNADTALYHAKADGRNCVAIADLALQAQE